MSIEQTDDCLLSIARIKILSLQRSFCTLSNAFTNANTMMYWTILRERLPVWTWTWIVACLVARSIYFQTFIEASSVLAQVEETVVGEMFGPSKTLGGCVGAFPEKIKLTHCFFRGSDEGTKKYFCIHIQTLINCHASLICKPLYLSIQLLQGCQLWDFGWSETL